MLLLVSAAAVIFMVFGLALFYAGQTPERSVANTLLMSFGAFAVVLPLWAFIGFKIGFDNVGGDDFKLFQGAFAVIATALISGAVAARMKFHSWLLFAGIWSLAVYSVLVLWTWNPTGWLYELGAIDLAGGGPIHIAAGASGIVLALLLGKRAARDLRQDVPLVILGAGVLTFGWIFFNAGSVLELNETTYAVALNTMLAAASGAFGWFVLDGFKHRRATALSGASGAVAGLVAITPSAAVLSDWQAVLLGLLTALAVYGALEFKNRLPVDDALDVAAFHLIAGVVGSLFAGAATSWHQLGVQGIAVGSTIAYSVVVTAIIGFWIKYTLGLRVAPEVESNGVDSLHTV
jgi:ammonium transporter, Amt family